MSVTKESDPKVRIPRKLYDELVAERGPVSLTAYVVSILELRAEAAKEHAELIKVRAMLTTDENGWMQADELLKAERERKHDEPLTDAKFDAHIERMGKEGHTA
jgi:6-phosphogluconolactonase/glucosamine-6-phosphate isomerase/deaminase